MREKEFIKKKIGVSGLSMVLIHYPLKIADMPNIINLD